MVKYITGDKFSIHKINYDHSTLISIFNTQTNECVFDVMSHEVGGIKIANKIIKDKLKELLK